MAIKCICCMHPWVGMRGCNIVQIMLIEYVWIAPKMPTTRRNISYAKQRRHLNPKETLQDFPYIVKQGPFETI